MIGHNITQNVADLPDNQKIVFHYAQWHINDYLEGTKWMSLEVEGVYIRFLTNLYQNGRPFLDIDKDIAHLLRLSSRVWKRLKTLLIEAGKITLRNGCLTNDRFEEERRKRAAETRARAGAARVRWENSRKVLANVDQSLDEPETKLPENIDKKLNEISDVPIEVHMLTNNQNPITNNQDKKLRHNARELTALLEEAAGEALADPASAPGLLSMAEPNRWIEQGFDLEKDILPTLRMRAAKSRPRSIRAWSYFAQAIADARADRLRPMPEGNAKPKPALPLFQTFEQRKAAAEASRISDMMMGAL